MGAVLLGLGFVIAGGGGFWLVMGVSADRYGAVVNLHLMTMAENTILVGCTLIIAGAVFLVGDNLARLLRYHRDIGPAADAADKAEAARLAAMKKDEIRKNGSRHSY